MEKQLIKFTLKAERTWIMMPEGKAKSAGEIAAILKEIHELEGNCFQEFFYALFLTHSGEVIGYSLISMGGMTGTVADPRIILKAALLTACTTIAIGHNHPSGNLKPSLMDEALTRKIKEAAALMDITLLDHIILSETGHFSFAEEGLL